MFSTTLRIDDDLGQYLAQVSKSQMLSINAFLTQLLERERRDAERRRLAKDWEAYAQEDGGADYALAAQAELVAEASVAYSAKKDNARSKASRRKP